MTPDALCLECRNWHDRKQPCPFCKARAESFLAGARGDDIKPRIGETLGYESGLLKPFPRFIRMNTRLISLVDITDIDMDYKGKGLVEFTYKDGGTNDFNETQSAFLKAVFDQDWSDVYVVSK